jgi:hypothetical protein
VVAFSHSDSLRLDALTKKVLLKIGGKRPGKECGDSHISADKRCHAHEATSLSGKRRLSDAGKRSAMKLAAQVRQRKGMNPLESDPGKLAARSQQQALRVLQGGKAKSPTARSQDPEYLKLKNLANVEYQKHAVSQSSKASIKPMLEANARLNDYERKAYGKTKIWEAPYDRNSEARHGYKGQKAHERQVKKAIERGESVPDSVMEQYPHLKAVKPIPQKPIKTSMRDILIEQGDPVVGQRRKAKTTSTPIEGGATAAAKRIENANPQFAKKRTTRGRSVDSADEPVRKTMGKFKRRTLNSGAKDGPIVTSRKQAIAIALSVAGKSK